MNEDIKILEVNENDRLTVSKDVVLRLKEINNITTELSNEEKDLRTQILDSMLANNIDKCESCGMTFSQVVPKSKGTFNTDEFMLNESEDVVKCFTTFTEESYFDEETFKKDNPELYEKYVKRNIIPLVDTSKLEKTLTPIFNKYYTEIQSDKPISLRIGTKKGE